MNNPKFSIIIPVYNVAPYLRECLESVLAQTFTDWEAICVDDGSTDCSREILNDYAAEDARIKVLTQDNKGVSAARNYALVNALGEYVVFCDSDDALVGNALLWLNDILVRNRSLDIVKYSYQKVSGLGDMVIQPGNTLFEYVDWEDERSACRNFSKYYYRFWAWNACYRRKCISGVEFEVFRASEDILFAVNCLVRARRLGQTNLKLYKYLQRNDSTVHRTSLAMVEDDLNATLKAFKTIKRFRYFSQVSKIAYGITQSILLDHYFMYTRRLPVEDFKKGRMLLYKAAYDFFIREHCAPLAGRLLAYVCFAIRSNVLFDKVYMRYLSVANRKMIM